LLSVTLVPVLMTLFVRGRIMPEQKNPLNRTLIWLYRPIINVVLRWPKIMTALQQLRSACRFTRSIISAASSCRP